MVATYLHHVMPCYVMLCYAFIPSSYLHGSSTMCEVVFENGQYLETNMKRRCSIIATYSIVSDKYAVRVQCTNCN